MKTVARIRISGKSQQELTQLYRGLGEAYPKFFKMDALSRLGYVATEMLLRSLPEERFVPRDDRAVVFCGRCGSLSCDLHYQDSLREEAYFPSPALFVYTLPNIVTGEVAIRNKYYGETCFYAMSSYDREEIKRIMRSTLTDCPEVLGGWLDVTPGGAFEAEVELNS